MNDINTKLRAAKFIGLGYILCVKSGPGEQKVSPYFECVLCSPRTRLTARQLATHVKTLHHVWKLMKLECPEEAAKFSETQKDYDAMYNLVKDFEYSGSGQSIVQTNLSNLEDKRLVLEVNVALQDDEDTVVSGNPGSSMMNNEVPSIEQSRPIADQEIPPVITGNVLAEQEMPPVVSGNSEVDQGMPPMVSGSSVVNQEMNEDVTTGSGNSIIHQEIPAVHAEISYMNEDTSEGVPPNPRDSVINQEIDAETNLSDHEKSSDSVTLHDFPMPTVVTRSQKSNRGRKRKRGRWRKQNNSVDALKVPTPLITPESIPDVNLQISEATVFPLVENASLGKLSHSENVEIDSLTEKSSDKLVSNENIPGSEENETLPASKVSQSKEIADNSKENVDITSDVKSSTSVEPVVQETIWKGENFDGAPNCPVILDASKELKTEVPDYSQRIKPDVVDQQTPKIEARQASEQELSFAENTEKEKSNDFQKLKTDETPDRAETENEKTLVIEHTKSSIMNNLSPDKVQTEDSDSGVVQTHDSMQSKLEPLTGNSSKISLNSESTEDIQRGQKNADVKPNLEHQEKENANADKMKNEGIPQTSCENSSVPCESAKSGPKPVPAPVGKDNSLVEASSEESGASLQKSKPNHNNPPCTEGFAPPHGNVYGQPIIQGFGPPGNENYGVSGDRSFGHPPNQQFGSPGVQDFIPADNQAFGPPGNQGFVPPGPQGFGPPGHQGFGPRGPQGFGPPGPQGFGPQGFGPPGPQGFGPRGPQGFGPPGPQGFGPAGPQGFGPAGPQGFGPAGPQGFGSPGNQFYGPPGVSDFVPHGNPGFGSHGNQSFGPPANQGFGAPGNQGFGPSESQHHVLPTNQGFANSMPVPHPNFGSEMAGNMENAPSNAPNRKASHKSVYTGASTVAGKDKKSESFSVMITNIPRTLSYSAFLKNVLEQLSGFTNFVKAKTEPPPSFGVAHFGEEEHSARAVRVLNHFPIKESSLLASPLYIPDNKFKKPDAAALKQDDKTLKNLCLKNKILLSVVKQNKLVKQRLKNECQTELGTNEEKKQIDKPNEDKDVKARVQLAVLKAQQVTKSLSEKETVKKIELAKTQAETLSQVNTLRKKIQSFKSAQKPPVIKINIPKAPPKPKAEIKTVEREKVRKRSRSKSRSRSRGRSSMDHRKDSRYPRKHSRSPRRSSPSPKRFSRSHRSRRSYRRSSSSESSTSYSSSSSEDRRPSKRKYPSADRSENAKKKIDKEEFKTVTFHTTTGGFAEIFKVDLTNVSEFFTQSDLVSFISKIEASRCTFLEKKIEIEFRSQGEAESFVDKMNGRRLVEKKLSAKITTKTSGNPKSEKNKMDIHKEDKINTILKSLYGNCIQKLKLKVLAEADVFTFRTEPCSKNCVRDTKLCFKFHGMKERRRSPKEFSYSPKMCPDYPNCSRKDLCTFSHTLPEKMFHPLVFKKHFCEFPYDGCSFKFLCTRSHRQHPDAIYHMGWKDSLIVGLYNTFFYFIGSIRYLYMLRERRQGISTILITPSNSVTELVYQLAKPVANSHGVEVTHITESDTNARGADILIATPTALAVFCTRKNNNASFKHLKFILFDDILTMMSDPMYKCPYTWIVTRFKKEIPNYESVPKLAVCETWTLKDVDAVSNSLGCYFVLMNPTNQKPAEKSQLDSASATKPGVKPQPKVDKKIPVTKKQGEPTSNLPKGTQVKPPSVAESLSSFPKDALPQKKEKPDFEEIMSDEDDGIHEVSSDVLTPEELKEMARKESELKSEHEESYSVYEELPEMHPKYESLFETFSKVSKKRYGGDEHKEAREMMWTKFWKQKLQDMKKTEWAETLAEFKQKFMANINKTRTAGVSASKRDRLNIPVEVSSEQQSFSMYPPQNSQQAPSIYPPQNIPKHSPIYPPENVNQPSHIHPPKNVHQSPKMYESQNIQQPPPTHPPQHMQRESSVYPPQNEQQKPPSYLPQTVQQQPSSYQPQNLQQQSTNYPPQQHSSSYQPQNIQEQSSRYPAENMQRQTSNYPPQSAHQQSSRYPTQDVQQQSSYPPRGVHQQSSHYPRQDVQQQFSYPLRNVEQSPAAHVMENYRSQYSHNEPQNTRQQPLSYPSNTGNQHHSSYRPTNPNEISPSWNRGQSLQFEPVSPVQNKNEWLKSPQTSSASQSSFHEPRLRSPYKSPAKNDPPVATKLEIAMKTAIEVLSDVSKDIQYVGESLLSLMEAASMYKPGSKKCLELLAEEDSKIILDASMEKLSKLVGRTSHQKSERYRAAITCLNVLLNPKTATLGSNEGQSSSAVPSLSQVGQDLDTCMYRDHSESSISKESDSASATGNSRFSDVITSSSANSSSQNPKKSQVHGIMDEIMGLVQKSARK